MATQWWEWLIPGWNNIGAPIRTGIDAHNMNAKAKKGEGSYAVTGNMKNSITPLRNHGWGNDLANVFGGNTKKFNNVSNLGAWFRDYATSQNLDDSTKAYLESLSDQDLGALLDEFWGTEGSDYNFLGVSGEAFDTQSALKEFQDLASVEIPEPSKSFQDILDETSAAIDAENAQAAQLYDNALTYQKNLYNSQMNHLDENYRRYANNVLSMDYQKNAQLVGSLENNMNKARQNALEAGASAGIRLANNVNTLLSTQNQQANQSLQTSNNLAQMLMNQQNAAMGLKSNLADAYATNANQKASLVPGTYERKQNTARNSWDLYNDAYEDQVYRATSGLEGNAFKDSYLKHKQGQSKQIGNDGY